MQGNNDKYRPLIRLLSRMMWSANPRPQSFGYTNVILTSDAERAGKYVSKIKSVGTILVWAWSEKSHVSIKLGPCAWASVHEKLLSWSTKVEAKFRVSVPGSRTYIILCLLYTSPSPRDGLLSRMPSSA